MKLLPVAAVLLASAATAQEITLPDAPPTATVHSSLTLTLSTAGNAEKHVIPYTCEGAEPFSVEYINAEPNFLALVPVDGQVMIFSAVMSGSGARYVAGEYEWWTAGPEGTLRNLAGGEDAPPLASCSEFSNTP